MEIEKFISLPPSVLDELTQERNEIKVYTMEDFLKLPVTEEYEKKSGNDPSKYYPNPNLGMAEPIKPEP